MRVLILALIVLLASMNGKAQSNVYFKAYDFDFRNNAGLGIIEGINSYYLCGSISSPGPNGNSHILSVDTLGDMIWEDTLNIAPPGGGEYLSQIVLVGYFYYAFGFFADTSIWAGNIFMARFDSSGTIDLIKTVDVCFNDRPVGATTDGGHIYLAGQCMDTALTGYDLFLAKVDTGGNIIWKQQYDYSLYEAVRSLDRTPDGGFIIGGDWFNPATQNWDLFLLKTDSLGNEEWHKSYGGSKNERYGYAVTTGDTGYAIAGTRDVNNVAQALLIKTDEFGIFEWERLYGYTTSDDYFKFMKLDAAGNYILAGTHGNVSGINTPMAWLSKVNPMGDTIWNRYFSYYGPGTHTYVEDLILTSDGGYAMTGYTLGPIATRNDLWVLKTDHLGRTCDSPPCHAVLWDTGTAVLQLPAPARATLAPNPTTGLLMLTLAEPLPREAMLTIYDVQGRTRRQWRLPAGQRQYTIHLGLPAGLYLIRLTSEGTMAWSGKVVVE